MHCVAVCPLVTRKRFSGPGVDVVVILEHLVEGDYIDDVEYEAGFDEELHQRHELEVNEDSPVRAVFAYHDESTQDAGGYGAYAFADGNVH